MEMGFWLNYRTGKEFRIDEHEQWIRKWTNAKKLGITKDVYDEMIEKFELRKDRDKMLLWLMSRTSIMRIRGHGVSVTFEFGSDSSKKPLESIWMWGEDYAGDYTHLHITNFKKKKVVNILYKDFKKYFDDGREDAIMEENAHNIRIRKSFKQFVEDKQLNESSLSRIWQHVENDDKSFGVISAYRADNDPSENKEDHKQLLKDINKLGYGYIILKGGYKEIDQNEYKEEMSIFIPKISKKEIIELGEKYKQDSVIYKDKDEFSLLGTNQNTGVAKILTSFKKKSGKDNITLAKQAVKEFYSNLIKGSHKDRKFVFQIKERQNFNLNTAYLHYGKKDPLKWTVIHEEIL